MRAIVIEPAHRGHNLSYVGHLLPELVRIGVETVLITSHQAAESAEFRDQILPIADQAIVDPCFDYQPKPNWQATTTRIRELRRAMERYRVDHVFIPTADGISQLSGIRRCIGMGLPRRDCEFEAAIHNTRFAKPQSKLSSRLSGRISLWATSRAGWQRWFVVDCLAYEFIQRQRPGIRRDCALLPDPVEEFAPVTKTEARRRIGIPEDGRYVGFCGLVNANKGFDHLVRAFASLDTHANDRLLFAGRVSPEMKEVFEREAADLLQAGRIQFVDRFLSFEEMHFALSAMDLVCIPYPRHMAISSILTRAAATGRPLIASSFGWIGHVTSRFGLGNTCDILDPGQFRATLQTSLETSDDYRLTEQAKHFQRFNSVDNYRATWTARIRERMGLPPSEHQLAWQASYADGI